MVWRHGPGESVFDFSGILGSSPRIREIFQLLELVAPSDATVLVLGETGTGKELVAQAIHLNSRRAARALHRGELRRPAGNPAGKRTFRTRKGPFTGAAARKEGRFFLAHQGTLFLDEIGELSLPPRRKFCGSCKAGSSSPWGAPAP